MLIEVDKQFKALKDCNLVGMQFNTVLMGKHVKKIERWYRLVKERTRYFYAILTFDSLPRIMVMQLIITVSTCVNAFAQKKGVSTFLSLLTIVEGIMLNFHLCFRAIYSEYL